MLLSGTRVIKIDEIVIKLTDHRKRGWIPKVVSNVILKRINFICALSSSGEVLTLLTFVRLTVTPSHGSRSIWLNTWMIRMVTVGAIQ
jgi:hypothetical protein